MPRCLRAVLCGRRVRLVRRDLNPCDEIPITRDLIPRFSRSAARRRQAGLRLALSSGGLAGRGWTSPSRLRHVLVDAEGVREVSVRCFHFRYCRMRIRRPNSPSSLGLAPSRHTQ